MRLKTLTASVVVLAIISAIVYFVQRPNQPMAKDPRVGQPLVGRDVVAKAAALQLTDQGRTVRLTRQANGNWIDASYHDLPADFSKLSQFVDDLTGATINRLVTRNPQILPRLEFKDTKIKLLDAAGKPLWSVTLGKAAENGGGRFIRFDHETKAYLASLNSWIDNDPKNWANAQIVNLNPAEVAKVAIAFAAHPAAGEAPATSARTVVVERAKQGAPWTSPETPAGQRVSADKISSLLSSIGNIQFTDTSAPQAPEAMAARAHERVFRVTTFAGKTYTIAMGRKPEEKQLIPPGPGQTGPASLGSVTALAKAEDQADKSGKTPAPVKPVEPKFKTIPAGPVYVFVSSSDASDPVNATMKKRAFQIGDYIYTGLPQKPKDLFEPAPKPVPPKPAPAKAAAKQPAPAKAAAGSPAAAKSTAAKPAGMQ